MHRFLLAFLACLVVLFFEYPCQAGPVTVFGPETFTRSKGKPSLEMRSFSAATGPATVTLINGSDGKKRVSSATVWLNETKIFGPEDFNQQVLRLEKEILLEGDNALEVTLRSKPGSCLSITIVQTVDPPVVTFSSSPGTIIEGEASTLSWNASGAVSCSIDQGIGPVDPSGALAVHPKTTTLYALQATNPGGTTLANATVTVVHLPEASLEAAPDLITIGESSQLTWSSLHAHTASISPTLGQVAVNGSLDVSPTATTTYLLTVQGPGGPAVDNATVEVFWPEPKVQLWADPTDIFRDESSVLYWNSTYAMDVVLDQDIGPVELDGYRTVLPQDTTTYTINATGPGGVSQDQTTVVVTGVPESADYGIPDEAGSGSGLLGTVSILSGNVLEIHEDIALPTPHQSGLNFNRTYNSRSSGSGPLGYCWTHTYAAQLDPAVGMGPEIDLKLTDATGRDHFFQSVGDAAWQGVYGETTRVVREDDTYVWEAADGTRTGFEASGRLLWIDDPVGNRLELSYNAAGRLLRVADVSSGRFLAFTYTGDLLDQVKGPVTSEIPDGVWARYAYDGQDNLVAATFSDGSGVFYSYGDPEDPHNLTQKHDVLGHLLASWSYDQQDRCTETNCSSCGLEGGFDLAYPGPGTVVVTDAYGVQRFYGLRTVGGRLRLTSLSCTSDPPYAADTAVRWVWDEDLNLVEIENASGAVTRMEEHDARGNPSRIILALGTPEERRIEFSWHPTLDVPLTRTEPGVLGTDNKITVWDYDDDGDAIPNEHPTTLLSRVLEQGATLDASGNIVPFTYATALTWNEAGQITALDGPLPGAEDTTSFSYDRSGNLLAVTRPLVGATVYSQYNSAGWVGRITDINNRARSLSHDAAGRITSVTFEADGSCTTTTYDAAGQIASTRDEDGVVRSFSHDPATGRLTRVTDQQGQWIELSYDPQGNRVATATYTADGTRSSFRTRSFDHPGHPGRLWREYLTEDVFTEYSYDVGGRLAAVVDGRGFTTRYDYDVLDRVMAVEQPGHVVTSFTYDRHGNQNSITDAEGHATLYTYDDLGRVVTAVSPDSGTTSYAYDEAGNLVQKTDARGITVTYNYDLLGRLTGVHFPNPAEDMVFGYDQGNDGKGRRTSMGDPSGTTAFSYDPRGRLTEKESTIQGSSYLVAREYSPGGRVLSMALPRGRTIDYARDTLGRIARVTSSSGSSTTTILADPSFFPFGGLRGLTNGAGGTVDNDYAECCGLLTTANPDAPFERRYTYDRSRNITQITLPNQPLLNTAYTYDALNRLTQASGPFGSFAYTYDDVGNRLTRTRDGITETYTYQPGTNRLTSVDNGTVTDFTIDAAGNTVGIGNRTLVYNQAGRMVRVEDANGNPFGSYTYNALEQRAVKTVDGLKRHYIYDFDGNLVYETKPDTTWEAREYLYLGSNRLALVDVHFNRLYFYQNDHLGTPQLLTDSNNEVVWEAVYDPFGHANVNPNALMENNHRFPGQYYDAETGFHYNWHRYYDTINGKYISPDPIGLTGGINTYDYAFNSPTFFTDHLGLLVILVHGTWSSGERAFSDNFQKHLIDYFNDDNLILFEWEGNNLDCVRRSAGAKLAAMISLFQLKNKKDEITIVGHSHGGNVALIALDMILINPAQINKLVTLGTPILGKYTPQDVYFDWVNVYSPDDWIQQIPSGSVRTHTKAKNIKIDGFSHSNLHTIESWNAAKP